MQAGIAIIKVTCHIPQAYWERIAMDKQLVRRQASPWGDCTLSGTAQSQRTEPWDTNI